MTGQKKFRDLLLKIVSENVGKNKKAAIFLSGGIDSCSLLFCLLELEIKPVAYTFHVRGDPSSDWLSSREVCEEFDIDLVRIKCPTNIKRIQEDVMVLADKWLCRRKTEFECVWPFMYMIPKIKEKVAISGSGSDSHFGLSKTAMLTKKVKESKSNFDSYRKNYFKDAWAAGRVQQKMICAKYGIEWYGPFFDRRVIQFLLRYDWDELNYRHLQKKSFLVDAFPEYFERIEVRPHTNLQVAAHIRELFEGLLGTNLNRTGTTTMQGFYRSFASRLGDREIIRGTRTLI